jgi:catechol 2,3-dioxygenase-like lactoylglutathione lyase family enzyme
MVTALGHPAYVVDDLDAALAFYEGVLGLRHAFDVCDEAGERTGVFLHVGGRGFLEIFRGALQPPAAGQSYAHLCLEVDDVAAMVAAIRKQGVEITEAMVGKDRGWHAYLSDPCGNRLELWGYTPESRQAPFME